MKYENSHLNNKLMPFETCMLGMTTLLFDLLVVQLSLVLIISVALTLSHRQNSSSEF